MDTTSNKFIDIQFKEKPSPFGIALLKIDLDQYSINEWCDKLLYHKDSLDQSNVKEIIFDIESSNDNFSNFSITPKLSNKLTMLKAIINFTKTPNL